MDDMYEWLANVDKRVAELEDRISAVEALYRRLFEVIEELKNALD